MQAAIADFLLACRADSLKPATIKWYTALLKPFERYCGHDLLAAVTARTMRAYIVSLQSKKERYVNAPQAPVQPGGYSPNTLRDHITALHRFWSWCSAEYDLPNPMKNIKRPRLPAPEPKAIAGADFVRLFNATGDDTAGIRDRAILCFFADTGCRLGGLLSLTQERLFIQQRRAVVHEKGNTSRFVVFTYFTGQLLQRWLDVRVSSSPNVFTSMTTGDPLTQSGIHELLKRLKRRVGVRGRVNPHSFRHNFAREYLLNGGDLVSLSKLLGHANINITAQFYAVFSRDELDVLHGKFTPLRNFIER